MIVVVVLKKYVNIYFASSCREDDEVVVDLRSGRHGEEIGGLK